MPPLFLFINQQEVSVSLCPRCKVNNSGAGVSRTDSKTNVCTDCEQAESFQDFLEGNVTPQDAWPVRVEVNK